MKNRKGQALIVVVIIMAVVMAIFANSLTTGIQSHSLTETEVYQREQALYLAEMGVNRMIFNINNGATYNDGNSISGTVPGIGSYKSTYHTPDDPEYGGGGYIESIGTVGEFSRRIFASVQSGDGSKEAFKYCLYTTPGNTEDGAFWLWNYPPSYDYNKTPGVLPTPDMDAYRNNADIVIDDPDGSIVHVKNKYNNKVVYVHMSSSDLLTVDFSTMKKGSTIAMSLITDANSVCVTGLNGRDWKCDKKGNTKYPLVVHSGTGSFEIEGSGNLIGFMYTKGYFVLDNFLTFISGEVMENNPQGYLNWAIIVYQNYYPPHFIVPGGKAKVLPGSFREEY